MSCSNIGRNSCAGTASFALGGSLMAGLYVGMVSTVHALPIAILGTVGGVYFAGLTLTARIVDGIFKKMGWENNENFRLFTAHVVAGTVVNLPLSIFMGMPLILAVAATGISLGINLLVNDWVKA